MSYQVLARKWRPRIFREMVGQEHVLRALINALDHNRLHHAYLFTGTRGVGKTTISRILAKCLNCETGVSSEPCDNCSACNEISEGRFVDLIEVDAASRTKVEDTRELLDNVQYAPTRGRYKIYLIDEVHMLSNHSFNALLKTLEEPPEHVKFLLATTDPQKLPVTILSRCLQFNLKNLSPERIVEHLQFVLKEEVIPCEEPALWQLARSADGSMRDALSLTDQAIAFGGGKVLESEVSSMLGTIDHLLIDEIMSALVEQDGQAILAAIAKFADHSPDYDAALADLITLLHRIAIAQAMPEALDNSYGDRTQILQFASKLASEDVQLFYQTALMGRRDLPYASDARIGFEMTLLRMLVFKPQGVADVPTKSLGASAQNNGGVQNAGPSESVAEVAPSEKKSESALGAVRNFLDEPSAPPKTTPEHLPATTAHDVASQGFASERPVPESRVNLNTNVAVEPDTLDSVIVEPPAEPIAKPFTETPVENPAQRSAEEMLAALEPRPEPPIISERLNESISAVPEEPAVKNEAPHGSTEKTAPPTRLEQGSNKETQNVKPIALESLSPKKWVDVYHQINFKGIVQSTAVNSVLVGRQENVLQFILDEAKTSLFDPSHAQRMGDLLTDYFNQPIRVEIQLSEVPEGYETPAEHDARVKNERREQALNFLTEDPVVKTLQQEFGAKMKTDSITF